MKATRPRSTGEYRALASTRPPPALSRRALSLRCCDAQFRTRHLPFLCSSRSLSSLGSGSSLNSTGKGGGHVSPLVTFWRFLQMGDFEIMRDVGSDAALYLRFQRMVIKLLLPMSIVSTFVLAPLHARAAAATAEQQQSAEGGALEDLMRAGWTIRDTTAHSIPAHSWVLWLDLAVCYAFSLGVFRFIYHFQRDILGKFNSIEAQTAATACTALVRNIPKNGVSDSARLGAQVHVYLQQLYGGRSVVSCVAVPRVRPLYLLEQRRKVVVERSLFLSGRQPESQGWWARWKLQRVNRELQQLRASVEKESVR